MKRGAMPSGEPAGKRREVEAADSEGEEEEARDKDEEDSGLHLDTIRRSVLDFDFAKVCSVSLSNVNVYACLVCGKYFQGRGPRSPAFAHALGASHHVFMHLGSLAVFRLPANTRVDDSSLVLADIRFAVRPQYSSEDVKQLDRAPPVVSRDLAGRPYVAGFVGLNNVARNDYISVIVQAMAHVAPCRAWLLLASPPTPLLSHLALLVRKMWSPRAFRPHVSPHDFVQQVAVDAAPRFALHTQADPADYLVWLLNAIVRGDPSLKGTTTSDNPTTGAAVIRDAFQGRLQVDVQPLDVVGKGSGASFDPTLPYTSSTSPFLLLTLDLPQNPLFTDDFERNIIPQIPLATLLKKYDGISSTETPKDLRRYRILTAPNYLILHIKRFKKSSYTIEKNVTIVTFPLNAMDLAPCTCSLFCLTFLHPASLSIPWLYLRLVLNPSDAFSSRRLATLSFF